ncbi:MAG: FAD binding domain-containing protein [Pseudonocardia sp.]|nr:FAD binding domain-containing protein [Pseudonocardia sp.]
MDLPTVTELRRPRHRDELDVRPGAAVLAGGTWLFSEPQDHLSTLVDVTGLGWTPVTRTADGISVAATCTIAELVAAGVPLATECSRALAASFKIAHMATVGGNIALALPAGSMTSLAVALDATAVLWCGPTQRRLPVLDLVTGVRTTALAPGEVLRSIELPSTASTARTAFRRAALSAEGRSGSVVIGRRDATGFVLTVTAAVTRPYRLAFPDLPSHAELVNALDTVPSWYDDPHGAPDWRRHVTGLLAEEIREELA